MTSKIKPRTALAIAGIGLFVLFCLILALDIISNWDDTPLDQLPVWFWVIYVLFLLVTVVFISYALQVAEEDAAMGLTKANSWRWVIGIFGLVIQFILLASIHPLSEEWTGDTILVMAMGLWILILIGLQIWTRHLARRYEQEPDDE